MRPYPYAVTFTKIIIKIYLLDKLKLENEHEQFSKDPLYFTPSLNETPFGIFAFTKSL